MSRTESESIQEKQSADLTKRMLEMFEAWPKFNEGKITIPQFEQLMAELRNSYLATLDKPKEPSEDLLWKQYELQTDLYKHYLEIILKFNAFYYAVTGAIISFYFTKSDVLLIRYALLFPVLMSVVFGILFSCGIFLNRVTRADIFRIRDRLNLEAAPEVNVLGALLALSALLMFSVAGVLLWFFFPNLIAYFAGLIVIVFVLMWLLFR